MIIDCHGHYTTTPPGVEAWREAQKAAVAALREAALMVKVCCPAE